MQSARRVTAPSTGASSARAAPRATTRTRANTPTSANTNIPSTHAERTRMAFIDCIPDAEIDADVQAMYARQQSFWGFVPNYAKVFSHRPEVMGLWAQLQAGIRRHMDRRRFELVTFAASQALRSTLCSLAHGKALTAWFSEEDVVAIARGEVPASLTAAE